MQTKLDSGGRLSSHSTWLGPGGLHCFYISFTYQTSLSDTFAVQGFAVCERYKCECNPSFNLWPLQQNSSGVFLTITLKVKNNPSWWKIFLASIFTQNCQKSWTNFFGPICAQKIVFHKNSSHFPTGNSPTQKLMCQKLTFCDAVILFVENRCFIRPQALGFAGTDDTPGFL